MSNSKKKLVERLERIFPNLIMGYPTELFNDENDCAPEYTITWFDFLEELEKNGIKINE